MLMSKFEQEIAQTIEEALQEPDPDPATVTHFVFEPEVEVCEESVPEPDVLAEGAPQAKRGRTAVMKRSRRIGATRW